MIRLIFILVTLTLSCIEAAVSQNNVSVSHFDKVIISPHIQVTLVEGNKETVTVESNKLGDENLNIEVKNKTLRIYLEDSKEVTKQETVEEWKENEAPHL